jgi:sulfur-oxidizing protein SoxY
MRTDRRRAVLLLGAAALVVGGSARAEDSGSWGAIRSWLFKERPIEDGSGLLVLDAPKRAHDAAVVPIAVRALQSLPPERAIQRVHLIIDDNPAPLAAVFRLGPALGSVDLSARVRVNTYTNVRAVAETADGRLWMVARYVKASGGCSAPAMKDAEQAMARIGRMKIKTLAAAAPGATPGIELLVSHPQYTGMQIDQLSRHWIPPDHLSTIAIRWNGEPVLDVEADISLSEDPALGFTLASPGPGTLAVVADDIKGRHFEQSWELAPGT